MKCVSYILLLYSFLTTFYFFSALAQIKQIFVAPSLSLSHSLSPVLDIFAIYQRKSLFTCRNVASRCVISNSCFFLQVKFHTLYLNNRFRINVAIPQRRPTTLRENIVTHFQSIYKLYNI